MPEEIKSLRERAIDEFVAIWTWTEADIAIKLTVDAMREYFETDEFKNDHERFYDSTVPKIGVLGYSVVMHAMATSEVVHQNPVGYPEYLFNMVKERVGRYWSKDLEFHVLMFAVKVLDWKDSWTQESPKDEFYRDARYTELMDAIVRPTQKAIAKGERTRTEAERQAEDQHQTDLEDAQATLLAHWLEERLLVMSDADLLKLKTVLLKNSNVLYWLLGDKAFNRLLDVIARHFK